MRIHKLWLRWKNRSQFQGFEGLLAGLSLNFSKLKSVLFSSKRVSVVPFEVLLWRSQNMANELFWHPI